MPCNPVLLLVKMLAFCEKNWWIFCLWNTVKSRLSVCFSPSPVNEGAFVYNGRPTVGGKVISAHCVAT